MKNFDFGGYKDALAMNTEEAELLYALVRAVKPKVVFEIGTHMGYSTMHLLEAVKDNGEGHVWTTDPFEFNAFGRILAEDRHWIDFLDKKGCDVKLDQKIDFVFVDGFHTIDDVRPEIANLLPQLSENAVVVFHDAQNDESNHKEGVNAAIKEAGLATVWLPTFYGLQIYQHNNVLGAPAFKKAPAEIKKSK
jgi:predicted O-methyltransferase YrrM